MDVVIRLDRLKALGYVHSRLCGPKKDHPPPLWKLMENSARTSFLLPVLPAFLLWMACCFLPMPAAAAPVEYTVEIPSLPDDLDDLLRSVSDSVALIGSPPDTAGLLRRRMEKDRENFAEALKSRGYFGSEVLASLETTKSPHVIRFHVELGPCFIFDAPALEIIPPDTGLGALLRPLLKSIKAGSGYQAALIPDTETAMLDELRKNGYPSPSTGARRVVADHATGQVHVRFIIRPGGRAVFGRTHIEGLERLNEEFAARHIAWKEGQLFDIRKVDDTRTELIRTGLFRSVRIETEHAENADTADMCLSLLEAPRRTVRAGLWYYSDLGPGTSAGWTNRNLFRGGQELHFDAEISRNLNSASAAFVLPAMWHPDQTLGLQAKYQSENTDSYDSVNLAFSGIMRRKFPDHLQLGYGLAYRLSEVKKEDTRRFHLLSAPLIAEYTTVTEPLDPSSGLALSARAEPFTDLKLRDSSFVSWNIAARSYWPLLKDNSLVLAARGHIGVLAGASRDNVPEDMLLYAGGGGSIRGYAYQYAGDLDEEDKPLGGLSAVDFSAELRLRFSRTFGFAIFGDGGGAFSKRNPLDVSSFFWGAGTGIRYYTPIGPLRLDVAVPLKRRSGVDAPFHFYVSLGQAF